MAVMIVIDQQGRRMMMVLLLLLRLVLMMMMAAVTATVLVRFQATVVVVVVVRVLCCHRCWTSDQAAIVAIATAVSVMRLEGRRLTDGLKSCQSLRERRQTAYIIIDVINLFIFLGNLAAAQRLLLLF